MLTRLQKKFEFKRIRDEDLLQGLDDVSIDNFALGCFILDMHLCRKEEHNPVASCPTLRGLLAINPQEEDELCDFALGRRNY